MKEKAAKLGKFNVVDVAAVILIVAAVVFVAWKVLLSDRDTEERPVTMTYRVLTEGVSSDLYESVQQNIPSQLMASGKLLDGEILAVEQGPYYVIGTDGEWSPDPQHVNLYFTVRHHTTAGEVLLNKVDEQEIRIGRKDYTLKTEYIEFHNAIILDIDWEFSDNASE
ncbi:MAG: DUF4330 domain-containing protein [Oscillibacter sp.]|nr:DUF4330 domain-containing protein [Oscillibacter sp.]